MRRRVYQASSLTSMIDVLFILVFASLAYAQSRPDAEAAEPDGEEPVADSAPDATPDPGDPEHSDAGPPPAESNEHGEVRTRAVAAAIERLRGGGVIVVRIAAAGELYAIETAPGDRLEVGVPLLERVANRDVNLAYLGDRSADFQLCSIVERYRRVDDHLIAVTPDRPLADLPLNLVEGIRRDLDRCRALGGLAVIVEPPTGAP